MLSTSQALMSETQPVEPMRRDLARPYPSKKGMGILRPPTETTRERQTEIFSWKCQTLRRIIRASSPWRSSPRKPPQRSRSRPGSSIRELSSRSTTRSSRALGAAGQGAEAVCAFFLALSSPRLTRDSVRSSYHVLTE